MPSDHCRRRSPAALAMSGLAVFTSVSLLVGCAIREFPITYVPQQNVVAIKNANAVSVEVKVEDLQPAESMSWDAVTQFHKRTISASKMLRTLSRRLPRPNLERAGSRFNGVFGALVTIQLGRLEALCEDDWSGLTALGYVRCGFRSEPQTGKVLYSREIKGEANPLFATFYLRCATPELARSALGRVQAVVCRSAFRPRSGDPLADARDGESHNLYLFTETYRRQRAAPLTLSRDRRARSVRSPADMLRALLTQA